ncbi:MAG: hypothetical protein UU02_C0039G0007 [Candidatus Woesebacteria bacterium GW2011_GWA1_40_43]|uniref:Uncharacterized protein n=1 Tax=Candidatus Woesebacteria bacterium GW2011_GWA1_40_43 TaxID=1618553 RepID=A0A0G0SDI5_9BACT|nr:MAG: hypothetical protein UT88_C0036G0006 [Candidatus Woesebacteria bacterium GW2011_GWD2_40_19]KKR56665.1 MAG: hypothetical protein UT96_C0037G0006 [Candidatus Woesebacteria bacterium GW2011_GWC2_40_30]KKR62909.1 MAG: hypothetical protein UU02_C0039G0007 [Candidatus Woesebacteria bacterium GW2011_GWA1_40_43]
MIIGPADTAAALAEAEDAADFQEGEDLLLVKTEADAKCSQLSAQTVEKSVKCLSGRQTVSRFIAVSVLKK